MWSRAIVGLLVVLITCHQEIHAVSSYVCSNGGTLDEVLNECICTANYHGGYCEFSFAHNNPCDSLPAVQKLSDIGGVHRLGNDEECGMPNTPLCVSFSDISYDWYRIESPAGNFLISQCPTGHQACGSGSPYILVDEVAEDNSNVILSKAKAVLYTEGGSSGCYDSMYNTYPVRILKCSSEITLYYLKPLPSTKTHYCIGNKSRCESGLTSIDGSGFEPCSGSQCIPRLLNNSVAPVLRLEYHRQLNNITYDASFYCNVYSAFKTNSSSAIGVLYLIEFELTFRNGTSVTISDPRCRWRDERIDDGKNKTFECRSENVLTGNSNVYGGTLICRVQARCNTSSSDYNSVKMTSNSHGFFFKYWFQDDTSVIKPDTPVTLCIDSKNIPVLGSVIFSISLGRHQIMPDRLCVASVRRDGNPGNQGLSCAFIMENIRYTDKPICLDIVPYNNDPDGRIPLGWTSGEQFSVVKVKISFTSSAAGLYTIHPDKTAYLQKIHDIELKIDFSLIEISLLQRNLMCSSENCSGAYLMVKPFLKSAGCICNIMVKSSMNFTAPTVFISGNIVMCELKKLHEWLVKELMMYSLIQIKLSAPTWESNNTIDLLVHQARCLDGPVQCNETSMTCQVEKSGQPRSLNSKVSDESDGINVCLPSVPTGSAVTPALHLSLLLIPTLLSVTAIGLANK